MGQNAGLFFRKGHLLIFSQYTTYYNFKATVIWTFIEIKFMLDKLIKNYILKKKFMLNKPLVTFNTSKLFANILRATQNIMRFNLQKFWCSVLYMTFRYFKLVYVTLRCFKLTEICFQKKKKNVNKNLCGLVFKTSRDYLDPKK